MFSSYFKAYKACTDDVSSISHLSVALEVGGTQN